MARNKSQGKASPGHAAPALDEKSWQRLLDIVRRHLSRRFYFLHSDDIEDASQEALFRLVQGTGHPDMDFTQTARWTCVVGENVLKAEMRRHKKYVQIPVDADSLLYRRIGALTIDMISAARSGAVYDKSEVDRWDDHLTAMELLESLPSHEGALLKQLCDGMTIEAIAQGHGLSVGACYKRMERSIKLLRESHIR